MSYLPLDTAARQAHMSARRLKWLCNSNSLDCHGAQYGGTFIVDAHTVERLAKRRERLLRFGGVRHG